MPKISELISPRITALVTTCDRNGKPNVATFSFLMPVSFDPKYVAFSVAPTRLTFENLNENKEFVLNLVDEKMLKEAWGCGNVSGRDEDKFKEFKLKPLKSKAVRPLRIRGCPIQLECKVEFMKRFGDHYLAVGRIVAEHYRKGVKLIMHHSGTKFYRVGEEVEVEQNK